MFAAVVFCAERKRHEMNVQIVDCCLLVCRAEDVQKRRKKRVERVTFCCCELATYCCLGHLCLGDYDGATKACEYVHNHIGGLSASNWQSVTQGACARCCCGLVTDEECFNPCACVAKEWNNNCDELINKGFVDSGGEFPEHGSVVESEDAARPLLPDGPAREAM